MNKLFINQNAVGTTVYGTLFLSVPSAISSAITCGYYDTSGRQLAYMGPLTGPDSYTIQLSDSFTKSWAISGYSSTSYFYVGYSNGNEYKSAGLIAFSFIANRIKSGVDQTITVKTAM